MAFIGKKTQEAGSKKAKITVSINKGRVGLVFRKGIVAPGTSIDVLIGTDEDFGFLLVKRGEGAPVSKFGNSDNVVSWGASRKASTIYPALKRAHADVISDDENGLLLKIVFPAGEGAPVEAAAVVEEVADEFGLGLDPEPVAVEKPKKEKKAKK